ncbi:MAG: NAD(P)-dependent alcohol dehydrogenase [Actinomycetes bacterium]
MKAWVYRRYGSPDVLVYEEIEAKAPGANDITIRVRASGLNAADWHIMRADPFLARTVVGLRRPRHPMIIGSDVAGIVESVGEKVTRFSPGDSVYAESMMKGGCAELIVVPEERAARMPSGLTFEQAAAVPMAGVTALVAVRDDGRLQPGQTVLINGASGGVGTFAVQIARALGGKVTASCSSGAVELVRSLGANEVIDYTVEDPIDAGRTYDLIVNIGGTHSLGALRRTLNRKGTLAAVGGSQHGGLLGPGSIGTRGAVISPFVGQRLRSVGSHSNGPDLQTLATMIENGELSPVIDRIYPLSQTPEALRYLEDGHPKGKVVVTVAGTPPSSRDALA